MQEPFLGKTPEVHPGAWVHPSATLIGETLVAERASVWPGAVLRADVAQRLAYLGVRVDATLNARPAHGHAAWAIHAPDSAVEVWVVPTDEGRVAAAEAAALVL